VVSTTEAHKIKLDQDGNVHKLKVWLCRRRPAEEEGPHYGRPTLTIIIHESVMSIAARHKARILQLDAIVGFLQARMRSRVFFTLPKVYGEVFPEFKE
jgi:hypothetical protein